MLLAKADDPDKCVSLRLLKSVVQVLGFKDHMRHILFQTWRRSHARRYLTAGHIGAPRGREGCSFVVVLLLAVPDPPLESSVEILALV